MVCSGHLHWPKRLDSENHDRRAELVPLTQGIEPTLRKQRSGKPSLVLSWGQGSLATWGIS